MNYDQPPAYGGPTATGYPAPPGYTAPHGPLAPGCDAQPSYPTQVYTQPGYPSQGYHAQGYYTGSNPSYPPVPPVPYPTQPGYQGYQTVPGQPQPQFGWQDGAHMYGNTPKNTVYMVEERRPEGRGVGGLGGVEACLGACWTALCCCCLWDMMT